MSVDDKIKQELDTVAESVKTEVEDTATNKLITMTVTSSEPDASDVNSTAQAESDATATDVAKQDGSEVIKSDDSALKEEEDTAENDEQNADGKQSAMYWNYHWPKVCRILRNWDLNDWEFWLWLTWLKLKCYAFDMHKSATR